MTDRSRLGLAAFMAGAGASHFVIPETYERIVPKALGHASELVVASGVAEIGIGALVARRRTARVGAWLAVGLLIAVYPANIQMAVDTGFPRRGAPVGPALGAWLRLPLQVPLVVWAVRVARRR